MFWTDVKVVPAPANPAQQEKRFNSLQDADAEVQARDGASPGWPKSSSLLRTSLHTHTTLQRAHAYIDLERHQLIL